MMFTFLLDRNVIIVVSIIIVGLGFPNVSQTQPARLGKAVFLPMRC